MYLAVPIIANCREKLKEVLTFRAQKSHKLPRDDEIVRISLHYNCA